MQFDARVYFVSAQEHLTLAGKLYEDGNYVMAHYLAGLAVERLFCAYRYRFDPEFDARHDLYQLYKAARFATIVPDTRKIEVDAALSELVRQWNSNHRYGSLAALQAYLKKARLDRGIQGDFVKENTRRTVNAAFEIVSLGVQRWKNFSPD